MAVILCRGSGSNGLRHQVCAYANEATRALATVEGDGECDEEVMMIRDTQEIRSATVAEFNRSRVVHHLYRHGVCTRAEIAHALELTAPGITKIVAKLIELGIVRETGDVLGKLNRRSIGLSLNENRYRVIGVKFARSLVEIGLFKLDGELLSLEDLPPVSNENIPETMRAIKSRVNRLLRENPSVVAVGVAVPGPYIRDAGYIVTVTTMQGWKGINFIDEFTHAFRVPVFIEQDARAGALAQSLFASSVTSSDIAYFLVGEGVGLGVIEHGRLVNGSRGAATEIGHVSIDVNGRPCECGNVGCLERYCSAAAIHAMLEEPANRDLIADIGHLTPAQASNALFDQAFKGEQRAVELVQEVARYVGYGCVTIINAFNPEQIIIGDIVAKAGHILLDEVNRVVRSRVLPDLCEGTEILLSTLPADATVTGAGAVAADQFLQHPSQFTDTQ